MCRNQETRILLRIWLLLTHMQVVTITYKTYPNGNRIDETETFISNGYQIPQRNRKTYEFNTYYETKSFSVRDIVTFDMIDLGLSNPSTELINKYPTLNWADWYDKSEDGTPIETLTE